jgi:hypothetical protein
MVIGTSASQRRLATLPWRAEAIRRGDLTLQTDRPMRENRKSRTVNAEPFLITR